MMCRSRGRRWISVIFVSSCVCEGESRPPGDGAFLYVVRNQYKYWRTKPAACCLSYYATATAESTM